MFYFEHICWMAALILPVHRSVHTDCPSKTIDISRLAITSVPMFKQFS